MMMRRATRSPPGPVSTRIRSFVAATILPPESDVKVIEVIATLVRVEDDLIPADVEQPALDLGSLLRRHACEDERTPSGLRQSLAAHGDVGGMSSPVGGLVAVHGHLVMVRPSRDRERSA